MFNQEDAVFFPRRKSLEVTFVLMGTYVGPSFSLSGMGGSEGQQGCDEPGSSEYVLWLPTAEQGSWSHRHVQSSLLFALCPWASGLVFNCAVLRGKIFTAVPSLLALSQHIIGLISC